MSVYDHYDLDTVNEQLERGAEFPFYEDRADPVDSWSEFREIPLLSTDELLEDMERNPPFGTLYHGDTSLTSLTPTRADDLLLEFSTEQDVERTGEHVGALFEAAGVSAGDVVVSCFSYTPFAGGFTFHAGFDAVGANVIPAGPGNSKQTAALIDTYDVDVLMSPPSFALEIASKGGTDVEYLICSGEPFTVVPGYRDEAKAAFDGVTTVDLYALSEVGPIACEDGTEDELFVADDHILLEILDPKTGEPVGPGEQGEVVVTHLSKEAQPLVRYRTGDLSAFQHEGDRLVLPRGIFGRVDEMLKVKGVKVYPGQLALIFHGTDGLTGSYRVVVTRPGNTDRLRIECEVDDRDQVDVSGLRKTIGSALLVTPDEVELVDDLDTDGMAVVDERFE